MSLLILCHGYVCFPLALWPLVLCCAGVWQWFCVLCMFECRMVTATTREAYVYRTHRNSPCCLFPLLASQVFSPLHLQKLYSVVSPNSFCVSVLPSPSLALSPSPVPLLFWTNSSHLSAALAYCTLYLCFGFLTPVRSCDVYICVSALFHLF